MLAWLVLGIIIFRTVGAWDDVPHMTIGYMAQYFVRNETRDWAINLLEGTKHDYEDYLGKEATWADKQKNKTTAPWHYVAASDDPAGDDTMPRCNIPILTECPELGGKKARCLISAIEDFTKQAQNKALDSSQRADALRYLIHFVGEITQPLHNSGWYNGQTNSTHSLVNFTGLYSKPDQPTDTLHHVWDRYMPRELCACRRYNKTQPAKDWAMYLANRTNNDPEWQSASKQWLSTLDIKDPKGTAISWWKEAHHLVCTAVMPDGLKKLQEAHNLYPDYYNDNINLLEVQIAKGGRRLAAWLDAIALHVEHKEDL